MSSNANAGADPPARRPSVAMSPIAVAQSENAITLDALSSAEWKPKKLTYAIDACAAQPMPQPSGAWPAAERERTMRASCGRMPPRPSSIAHVERMVTSVIRTMYSTLSGGL
jgi:hypothetical protein